MLLSCPTKLRRLDGTSPQLSHFCKLLCRMSSLARFLDLVCSIRSHEIHFPIILITFINLLHDPSTSISKILWHFESTMNSTGGAPLFFGIHLGPNQYLRRSSRIAARQAIEAGAWSTCGEPSQFASSHTNQVPRHASFRCDGSSCDCCSQTVSQCIEV